MIFELSFRLKSCSRMQRPLTHSWDVKFRNLSVGLSPSSIVTWISTRTFSHLKIQMTPSANSTLETMSHWLKNLMSFSGLRPMNWPSKGLYQSTFALEAGLWEVTGGAKEGAQGRGLRFCLPFGLQKELVSDLLQADSAGIAQCWSIGPVW